MRNHITIGTFLTFVFASCAVKYIPVDLRVNIETYSSTSDFLNDTPDSIAHYSALLEQRDNYVRLSSIFEKKSHKRLTYEGAVWAIKLNDVKYLNMYHSKEYENSGLFVNFDIEGEICALLVDKESSKEVRESGRSDQYEFGLAGYLTRHSNKWGKSWKDSEGKSVKILTINTIRINPKTGNLYKKHLSILLTKKNFNDQLNTSFSEDEIAEFKVEDVVAIIEDINQKAENRKRQQQIK